MFFNKPLQKGILIKRYKRFLADIELSNGEIITAHCPNTGAMTGCAEPGFHVYVSSSDNPKRKLAYTWELSVTHEGHWIGVNTQNANKLIAEALESRELDIFKDVDSFTPEITPPNADSRFDFALTLNQQKAPCYLEVKSVTLLSKGQGYFPDAITTRGQKHIQTLTALKRDGIDTQLVFCVQHTGIKSVEIAGYIDSRYNELIEEAAVAGVKIHAVGCIIDEQKIKVNQTLEVKL